MDGPLNCRKEFSNGLKQKQGECDRDKRFYGPDYRIPGGKRRFARIDRVSGDGNALIDKDTSDQHDYGVNTCVRERCESWREFAIKNIHVYMTSSVEEIGSGEQK